MRIKIIGAIVIATAAIAAFFMLSKNEIKTQTLRIATTPGALADSLYAAVTDAKAQGIDLEVVEFIEWAGPNISLDNEDVDLNYFQHTAFLNKVLEVKKYPFKVVAYGVQPNIGLYSLKHKSMNKIPYRGKVSIANDPVNQGRGLLLLQKAGLIKLKEGVGYLGKLDDIVENPKELTFLETEGPQIVRVINDMDIAVCYPAHIVIAKTFDASSGLIYSGVEDILFAITFVAKDNHADDPLIHKFIDIYHNSQAVRDAIHKANNNDGNLYSIAWSK
ncbi:MAG: MetQ/NlpA family ABC transporter substrate-binding protein [Campylobacteraceae bacterium]|jgi:D-methionine transport system substrate-binding protein|nr:MetQ/NlpA family ABC transporter substrate-binding protein [Campylobacteraceae bacterium]